MRPLGLVAALTDDFVAIALRDEYERNGAALVRGVHDAPLRRWAVPVRMQVRMTGPVDREQEAVAYFVVAEALTNIAKHAAATTAEVTVLREGPEGELRVRVADDGRGGAATLVTGLRGIFCLPRIASMREMIHCADGRFSWSTWISVPIRARSSIEYTGSRGYSKRACKIANGPPFCPSNGVV